eukprot:1487216-Pyramimonas_sp.AAC.5
MNWKIVSFVPTSRRECSLIHRYENYPKPTPDRVGLTKVGSTYIALTGNPNRPVVLDVGLIYTTNRPVVLDVGVTLRTGPLCWTRRP